MRKKKSKLKKLEQRVANKKWSADSVEPTTSDAAAKKTKTSLKLKH